MAQSLPDTQGLSSRCGAASHHAWRLRSVPGPSASLLRARIRPLGDCVLEACHAAPRSRCRPSSSASAQPGLLMPLGFSLLLSAAARDGSLSLVQGAVGLAASTLIRTATVGREVLNLVSVLLVAAPAGGGFGCPGPARGWDTALLPADGARLSERSRLTPRAHSVLSLAQGLFLPAAATRLLPGWGLLFGAPTQPAAPASPQQPPPLQERIRFTLTHGVEPLKAIHQHHHAKQQQQQARPAAGAAPWHQALPVPPAWASPHHHHGASSSKAAADALRARTRVAQRMQQGKALFRLPPPHAGTTLVPAGNGWMVSTSGASAQQAPAVVLSRCASSVAAKAAKVAPPPSAKDHARASRLVQRGALASGAVSSEDEEWLPLTHLALRSSLL